MKWGKIVNEKSYKTVQEIHNNSERKSYTFFPLLYTGFNGLWRENSKGFNNVPYGDRPFPFSLGELLEKFCKTSELIQNVIFRETSYIGKVVYADPPYQGQNFTSYSRNWTQKDWQKLTANLLEANRFILSNSNAPEMLEFCIKYKLNLEFLPTQNKIKNFVRTDVLVWN